GMFARAWLSVAGAGGARLYAPAQAVVRRAEMTGVYVIDPAGRPVLRQVRLGRTANDSVEILSGVAAGERVATDPQAASRVR
ncbi:MAG TPA: efflux RND transporter periplasmic adaptor subunit, partial [Albitalea sp.]|nr:efflux RND transporter periplasmic adaptor subunit [Albitalea sp.]